jgi:hypothetical protein
VTTALATKQDSLVSGTNIKTINSNSLLGSGDVAVQETLVSGTNIKTLNNTSLLGSGNITLTANPSGIAGAIQFSNGSAFASDATNLFWDDTNNRLGVGTKAQSATAHIKGSGTTSATTSLLVQNSAGTAALTVSDDGSAAISGPLTLTNGSQRWGANNVSINLINASKAYATNGLGLYLATNVGGSVGYSSIYMRNVTSLTPSSGSTIGLHLADVFAPTTGTAEYNSLLVAHTINQTGGANGITRGLYIAPTLTAAADFRAIQTTAGKIIFGGLPTSSSGLVSGQLWNDAGTLKIA